MTNNTLFWQEIEEKQKNYFKKIEEFLNPALNPLLYDDLALEDIIVGHLANLGFINLPKQESSYILGESLAATKGIVLYENEVMQLLYYHNQKSKTHHQKPLLIVPPWINKYYIFDLSPHNSFIAWALEHNISIYCISWINADSSHSQLGLNDYLEKGIIKAMQIALIHSRSSTLNVLGYCVGGMAVNQALEKMPEQFESITYLATPFDFTKLNNLNQFINKLYFSKLQSIISSEGIYHGDRMLAMFSSLRAQEMIYQDVINRVYLKKPGIMMDYLHWNSDVTNLPGQLHLDYIQNIYMKNALLKKKSSYKGDVFIMCAQKDHIVPLEASFAGARIHSNITFCVSGGGHVAGVIHNPNQIKYGHWVAENTTTSEILSISTWLSNAHYHEYSWWHSWLDWIKPHLGENITKLKIDNHAYEVTPGRYALQKTKPLTALFLH